MAITFETFSFLAINAVNHGNMIISKPAGTVEGDLLLWTAHDDRSGPRSFTLPAGWTLIEELQSSQSDQLGATAFKIAGSSEPATYTFQILATQTSSTVSSILRFSTTKVFPANPIDVFTRTTEFFIQSPPVDFTCPTATVVSSEATIVRLLIENGAPANYGDGNFSYLSGPAATEILDKGTSTADRSGLAAYVQDSTVGPGATGTSVIRFNPGGGSTGFRGWAWTIALLDTALNIDRIPVVAFTGGAVSDRTPVFAFSANLDIDRTPVLEWATDPRILIDRALVFARSAQLNIDRLVQLEFSTPRLDVDRGMVFAFSLLLEIDRQLALAFSSADQWVKQGASQADTWADQGASAADLWTKQGASEPDAWS